MALGNRTILLTDEGKATARYLVQAWDQGVIESRFELIDLTAGGETTYNCVPGLGVLKPIEFDSPPIGTLYELDKCDLIVVDQLPGRKWTIQLSQSLREAVKSNFMLTVAQAVSRLPSIFVSYSTQDKPYVEDLAKLLNRVYGPNSTWFDQDLVPAQRWWDEIVSQISGRDFFIYLLSREALESVYCRAELSEALRLGKQILPIRIREWKIPAFLKQFQLVPMVEKITVDGIVGVFAAITQSKRNEGLKPPETLWATRVIQPIDDRGISVNLRVLAAVEPDNDGRELCNTGILLMPNDQMSIRATGKVTIDGGSNWMDPCGLYPHPQDHTKPIFVYSSEAYRVKGYSQQEVGENGVVGSLFGWIGETEIDNAFFVGEYCQKDIKRGEEGFLYLAVNDRKGTYGDNQEGFDVTIEIRNMN